MATLTARKTSEEGVVSVTAWGATTTVPFTTGKSVGYYLKQAQVSGLSSNQTVRLNDKIVRFLALATVRQPGSKIEVINKSQL